MKRWQCFNCDLKNPETHNRCMNCGYDKYGIAPHREKVTIKENSFLDRLIMKIFKIEALAILVSLLIVYALYAMTGENIYSALVYLILIIIAVSVHSIGLIYLGHLLFNIVSNLISIKKGKGFTQRVFHAVQYRFFDLVSKKILLVVLPLVIVLIMPLYMFERDKWINSQTKFHDAKEYFVVGETLSLYREVLSKIIYPDSLLIEPLTLLQKVIYNKGVTNLPKEDAEDALWYGMWFIKPYSTQMYIPSTDAKRHNDKSTARGKILEAFYPHLKKLSTANFEDKKMYEIYLKAYPYMLSHYSYYQNKTKMGSGNIYIESYGLNDLTTLERNRVFFEGLTRHRKQWRDALVEKWGGYAKDRGEFTEELNALFEQKLEMKTDPKDEVAMSTAMIAVSQTLIYFRLRREKYFTCQEPYVEAYSKARNRLFGLNKKGWINKLNPNDRGDVKFMWAGNDITYQYITEQICKYPTTTYGVAMFGKEKSYVSDLNSYSKSLYTMMKLYEKNHEKPDAVKSIEKYIGVLVKYEHYKKQFSEIDKKIENGEK